MKRRLKTGIIAFVLLLLSLVFMSPAVHATAPTLTATRGNGKEINFAIDNTGGSVAVCALSINHAFGWTKEITGTPTGWAATVGSDPDKIATTAFWSTTTDCVAAGASLNGFSVKENKAPVTLTLGWVLFDINNVLLNSGTVTV